MAIIPGQGEPIKSLIKAMGLDPKQTSKVVIMIQPDDVVRARVTKFVYDEEIKEMTKVVERYSMKLERDGN